MRISFHALIGSIGFTTAPLVLSTLFTLASINAHAQVSELLPQKGMTQAQVKEQFGEPTNSKPAVGNPPISRWDYPDYSVYFEGKYVIHSFSNQHRIRPQLNPAPAQPQAATPQAMPVTEEAQIVETTEASDTEQAAKPAPQAEAEVVEVTEESSAEQAASPASQQLQEAEVTEVTEVTEDSSTEDMQATEEAFEDEKPVSAEVAEANTAEPAEEKDMNFEEAPKNVDFGRWGQ